MTDLKYFYIYKKTRKGIFHCTTVKAQSLNNAIEIDMKNTGTRRRNKYLEQYKVSGLRIVGITDY